MSERRTFASGDLLAGRYELQELVSESLGASNWRAVDQILHRNVRVELLPDSDPRSPNFLQAARSSTQVTDHRFLRVLDLAESEQGMTIVVREWARAAPLHSLLGQSPLPSRRAASIVAEVAEALAHAHEHQIFHRRLAPHQVLLKESGAVRIVGLGVATALAPPDHRDTAADLEAYEAADVQAIGKLLYACLVSRWPGGHVDGLRAAPTEHGRLLRPRQVRAGVARDLDAVCDQILDISRRPSRVPLSSAAEIAQVLYVVDDDEPTEEQPALAASPDLLRLDPVVVPAGPPPGLEPPRRRPKAYEPAPPTRMERGRARARDLARGDRALILAGVVGTVMIAAILAFLVGRETGRVTLPTTEPTSPVEILPVEKAIDFDPQGEDLEEGRDSVALAIDDDPGTGWRTSTYIGNARLGGLKDGVGLILDLGTAREVDQVRIRFAGSPTDLSILTAPSTMSSPPERLADLTDVATLNASGTDAVVALPAGTLTRYVVVWLRSLPEVEPDRYRGEIRSVVIRGR